MMQKVYIDTNIFDYVVLKHPKYGKACKEILNDVGTLLDAVCSIQVPIEILGSLSEIDKNIALKALLGFFSFKLKIIETSEKIILSASKLSLKSGINGYDAVHTATMKKDKLKTIITENYSDFKKIKGIRIVRPLSYKNWKKSL
jgi:predicted nucleic acid-binding protein